MIGVLKEGQPSSAYNTLRLKKTVFAQHQVARPHARVREVNTHTTDMVADSTNAMRISDEQPRQYGPQPTESMG